MLERAGSSPGAVSQSGSQSVALLVRVVQGSGGSGGEGVGGEGNG